MRLFLAVKVPVEVMRPLLDAAAGLRGVVDGRWSRAEDFHLTLKFIGEVRDERLADLIAAADETARGIEAFTARSGSFCCFPGRVRPRVLWAGIGEGAEALRELAKNADRAFGAAACEPSRKRFIPHITLCRIKKGSLAGAVFPNVPEIAWEVPRIMLVKSSLTREGAVHETLHETCLSGT